MKNKFVSLAVLAMASAGHGQWLSYINATTQSPNWLFQVFFPTGSGTNTPTGVGNGNGTFNPGLNLDPYKDAIYQSWFWYRGGGDPREYMLVNQWEGRQIGNQYFVSYVESTKGLGQAYRFDLTYELLGVDSTSAVLKVDWTVTNQLPTTQQVNWFVYNDLQSQTDIGTNKVTYDPSKQLFSFIGSGATDPKVYLKGFGATPSSYDAMPWPQTRNNVLADAYPATNLSNSVFSSLCDPTACWQYIFTLAPSESRSGGYLIGYNVIPNNPAGVSGTLDLGPLGASPSGKKMTLSLRLPGTQTIVERHQVSLDGNGAYSFATIRRGTFDVAIEGLKYLRKVVPNVSVGDAGIAGLNAMLLNGDIDNDNSITVFDYGVISDFFDKTSEDWDWKLVFPNGHYPHEADLDLDGAITVFDYGILSDNFDLNGDD